MKRVIITGTSGMIGNIVLEHCLESDQVSEVISIARKGCGKQHIKLREVIHKDFTDYTSIASQFQKIDVAYFCIGVYTGAVPDAEFKTITVDYTTNFADTLKIQSPNVTFCFLSGQGADRTEKSGMSFAKYKGMAENHLINLSFQQLYIFRPSYIYPVMKRTEPNFGYRIFRILYPILGPLLGKNSSIKSTELGKAMFDTGINGADMNTLENAAILNLLNRH
jgi:nucleoside-diphosphate-sugar epimerase